MATTDLIEAEQPGGFTSGIVNNIMGLVLRTFFVFLAGLFAEPQESRQPADEVLCVPFHPPLLHQSLLFQYQYHHHHLLILPLPQLL